MKQKTKRTKKNLKTRTDGGKNDLKKTKNISVFFSFCILTSVLSGGRPGVQYNHPVFQPFYPMESSSDRVFKGKLVCLSRWHLKSRSNWNAMRHYMTRCYMMHHNMIRCNMKRCYLKHHDTIWHVATLHDAMRHYRTCRTTTWCVATLHGVSWNYMTCCDTTWRVVTLHGVMQCDATWRVMTLNDVSHHYVMCHDI